MSTPIPEDVMRAAKAACDAHGIPAMGVPFVPSDACRVAMTAIMAEREAAYERCAKIAEIGHWECGSDGGNPQGPSKAVWTGLTGPEIASAIRDRSKT